MARGQFHAGGGQEIDEGIGRGRHGLVDGVQHRFILMRAGNGEDGGVRAGDVTGFRAEATGDDDAAVFGQRLADRLKAFGLGAVEKAAGVDDDRLGAAIVGADLVALGAQARQDTLAVHKRLGAAERDHADGRLPVAPTFVEDGAGREVRAEIGRVLRHWRDIAQRPGVGEEVAEGLDVGREIHHVPHVAALPREFAAPLNGPISDTRFQFPITQGS